MSSDPIEVLREALIRLEEAARAVQAGEMDRQSIQVERDAARAALASLSAPKPDAWSRIHETPEYAAALVEVDAQIAAGKPESAEAVVYCQMNWTPKGLHKHEWACRHCGQKVRRNSADGHPHIPCAAPPRPEASAPVGVGYAKRLATWLWQQHYREDAPQWEPCDDLMGLLSQIDNMVSGLTRSEALAQQPAAVDEAIGRAFLEVLADPNTAWRDTGAKPFIDAVSVLAGQQPAAVDEATRRDAERYRYLRRPEAWKENYITERGASAIFIGDGRRGEAKDGEALDAAIDRILAGQQP